NSWCYDRLDGDRFADQKYLDEWPNNCQSLVISQHVGVNVAPWNKDNYQLTNTNATPHVDDCPIVCYHFHALRIYSYGIIQPLQDQYGVLSRDLMRLIYRPYLEALGNAERSLAFVSQGEIRETHLTP